ncbi:hypothetical protein HPG69_008779 [Diceros bicornis minor]|uniref:Uncharacterized protein n=1 Tax=Diceros bicornis minor TaxID=77932 RepID=A0A7J7FAK1_DICBM|nr:hypothetical protein HPG69_008779 [Diceros bicornis minor]
MLCWAKNHIQMIKPEERAVTCTGFLPKKGNGPGFNHILDYISATQALSQMKKERSIYKNKIEATFTVYHWRGCVVPHSQPFPCRNGSFTNETKSSPTGKNLPIIGKTMWCQTGNDNYLKHDSIFPSQEMNLMLSGNHVRFFPYNNNSDLYRTRKDLDIDFEDNKHRE